MNVNNVLVNLRSGPMGFRGRTRTRLSDTITAFIFALSILHYPFSIASAQIRTNQLADYTKFIAVFDGSFGYCPDSGSNDTYVCNRTVALTAYVTGSWIDLKPNTINTGAATVNVNSLGAKTIVQHDGSALTDGLLQAGRSYRLTYDGTNFRMQAGGTGSGTITGSGTSGKIAKFTGSSAIGDSALGDDGSGNISYGDVSGNHHAMAYTSPTGTHTHTWPAVTGTVAQTTGSLTTGNCAKFDSSGRLVDHGSACGGTANNAIIFGQSRGSNIACSAGGGTTQYAIVDSMNGSGDAELPIPFAGTVKNLYVRINNDSVPGSQTLTVTARKNGADQALTTAITAGNSTGSDTSNSFAVAAGDRLDFKFNCAGGTTAISNAVWSVQIQ